MTSVGVVWCWGYNAPGQLGDASTTDSNVPVQVSGLGSGAVAISAGSSYSCAVITGGTVKCWGDNGSGQLGNGSTGAGSSSLVDVVGLGAGASAVSAGGGHTCAVTTASGLQCWGDNGYGQLGNGSTGAGSSSPVGVTGLGAGAATAVAAGSSGHSCAVSTGGAISCWGHNANGQLGNGTLTDSWTPVDVTGLGALASAVSAGDAQSCALTAGGAVRCWGANESGQLGDGTTNQSATPVDVFGLK
jgi:alpha-tubulin suppressor-like RCC1 family protein